MNTAGFSLARLPRIEFGAGKIATLAPLAAGYGGNALLISGARSLKESSTWARLEQDLQRAGLRWHTGRRTRWLVTGHAPTGHAAIGHTTTGHTTTGHTTTGHTATGHTTYSAAAWNRARSVGPRR